MANNSSNGEEIQENEMENLSIQFKTGLDNYNAILNSDKPTNSPDMQVRLLHPFYYDNASYILFFRWI